MPTLKLATRLGVAVCLVMTLGLACGCSRNKEFDSGPAGKAFSSAAPDLRTDWEAVVDASRKNDFVTGILGCRKLQGRTDLTDQQRASVNEAMQSLNDRMSSAAARGDVNASNAIVELRKRWRSN